MPERDEQERIRRLTDRRPAVSPSIDVAPQVWHASTGFASGWMMVRGARRQRAVDRGFVLCDHADWPELNEAIRATEAETVYVTHGFCAGGRPLAEREGHERGAP